MTQETPIQTVELQLSALQTVNFALQHNKVPLIRNLTIINNTDTPLEQVELFISASPAFCLPFSRQFEYIGTECTFQAGKIDLMLDGAYLAGLTEKVPGLLTVELRKDSTVLASQTLEMTALAYDEWHGSGFHPELLSAFVTPNHPSIISITARAAELLQKWTKDPSLDAYQTQDPNRVLQQAGAIYAALQEQNIVYTVPPASFEAAGQRVRLCDAVLQQKMGTCLDLSLLYASCLESVGLHPILLLKPGHIFAGVWLEELTFPEAVQDDVALVTKRLTHGVNELAVVECTAFVAGKNLDFDQARNAAEQHLQGAGSLEYIIDVHRSRLSGISPLPQRIRTDAGWEVARPVVKERDLTTAPKAIDPASITEAQPEVMTKKLQWERKLLDLGLRNNLINMRLARSTVPVLTPSIDELEDHLSGGSDFSIHARPNDYHNGAAVTFETMHDLQGNEELIQSEFKNRRLRSTLTETELTKALKELYRSAKTSLEENGANTLYLALGLLRWYETDRSTKARYAPIVLLPVEMVRKSAKTGYVIRLRDDEPQMNVTMLEKLKQDHRIIVSGLDPLPTDEQGIDLRRVFTTVRKAIMNQPKWDVLESAYLGIFSFSQFVMWNDIRNRSDELAKNKIVRSLMDGKLSWEPYDMTIGDRVPEDGVFLPMAADASQLFAIEAANNGKSFVLHGPPGTGKSQTITTLIANALAQGKTVLFVAEKMAALEVVQRRLSKIGLGPFCLELHSNKSKKRDVLEQLRLATEVTKTTSAEEFAAKADKIGALRQELTAYADSLHRRTNCGLSLFDLVNRYEENCNAPELSPFPSDFAKNCTAAQLAAQDTLAEQLVAAAKAVGHPKNHPLQYVSCTKYSQQIRHTLPGAVQAYLEAIGELRTALEEFAEAIGSSKYATKQEIQRLYELAQELQLWQSYPAPWAKAENPNKYFIDLETMAKHFVTANDLKKTILTQWKPEFLEQNGKDLAQQWDSATGQWFLPRLMGQNGLARRLSAMALSGVPKEQIREHLTRLINYQNEKAAAENLLQTYSGDLGNYYAGEATDWQAVQTAASAARLSAQKLDTQLDAESIRKNAARTPAAGTLCAAWKDFGAAKEPLYTLLTLTGTTRGNYLDQEEAMCRAISENSQNLKDWIAWNDLCTQAQNTGMKNVVTAYRSGMAHEDVLGAYRKAIYKALAMEVIDSDKNLQSFSGAVFNEKIRQFKRLDQELTEVTQKEIYCRLASKVPNFSKEAAHSSELGILQRAIRSGGRGVSIRKLFEQIPNLLPRLCPCMLMSPISAAQYLDPKREGFHMVVFDEASQLPTCKAVGALARGENAVIVGDPKQLPPTAFFASNTVDEENLEIEDLESILDDCLALNIPQAHLLWHYRSRHESLIAFSNAHFYENKLYTFPSVNDRASKVNLIHVEGVFERGKNRQNRAEAQAIIEELKRRCHDPILSKQSVGVVTFNINQQNLIDDLLVEACKEDAALDQWAFQSAEPLFIKNLENVQGDERDVILFSIGYGPDETGKVYMNFGPLNRDGGWRRLNVAITRARQEMTVFATLTPEQIDLDRTSAEGVSALKAFLEYAQKQTLPQNENTVRSESRKTEGIAASICEYLKEQGFETQRNVGHSEYKLDIGVIDPQKPDQYKLGIMLDGHTYGTAKTARDREIAQIGVLNGLGWRIHRVWTMDWWDNTQKELDRIVEILNEPIPEPEAAEESPVQESPAQAPQKLAESTPSKKKAAPTVPYYTPAKLRESAVTAEDLLLPKYAAGLRKKLETVVAKEAPIAKSLLLRRVVQSYGITRAGSRITAYLEKMIEEMKLQSHRQEDMIFYWAPGQDPESYFTYRPAPSEEDRRDAKEIPVQEAAGAVCQVLEDQISLNQDDLIRESAKLLGYTRLGTAVTYLFSNAIRYAQWKNKITQGTNGNWTITK